MTPCELCEKDGGLYDFGRDCCLTRFILHVPTKTIRAGFLAYWMKKYGEARTEKIKLMVAEAWEKKRVEALKFGRTQG